MVIVALVKAVLQNAPHLHVRQGEGLDLIMFLLATLFSPDHDSVERLSGKGDDRAIAMNRSPAQVVDGEVPAAIWNLDVRVSSSRLGEYLDPHIHGFMVMRVIGQFLAHQPHGDCSRLFRQRLHVEFFGRYRRPVVSLRSRMHGQSSQDEQG